MTKPTQMAIGLSPKFVQEIKFENLTAEQILIFGLEAAKRLAWEIGPTSTDGFVAYTRFSWGSWSEEFSMKIESDKVILKSECTGSQFIDWGKNKKNVEKFLIHFNAALKLLTDDEVASRMTEIQARMNNPEDSFNQPVFNDGEKGKGFISILIPTDGYFVTPILILVNILIFILMIATGVDFMLPSTESLIAWGANFKPVTLDGQWWRLITSCFIHIGIFHVLMNMYALLYIGMLLEPYLGKTRFLVAYILSGVGGSVASLFWNDLTVSAGASGAIFGMYGVFLAMLTTNLIEKAARKTFLTSIVVFVGYNLLNGLKGGIDNAAHIGGLITGAVFGYSFYFSLKNPQQEKIKLATLAIPTLLLLMLSYIGYHTTSNDIGDYQKRMEKFVSFESMAMEVYHKDGSASNAELLEEIKDRGIYYWNESIKLIQEADKLNLPEQLHERNKKLIRYCELRIESFRLLYKAIDEDTDRYKDQMEDYDKEIVAIIESLNPGE